MRLVYSTRTEAMALVPAAILAYIVPQRFDPGSAATPRGLGLLVENQGGEKKEAFGMIQQVNSLRRVMNVSIIVNLRCNFRCRYMAFQRNGQMEEADCWQQPYFDATLETIIMQELRYGQNGDYRPNRSIMSRGGLPPDRQIFV